MLREKLLADPRLVIKAMQRSFGCDLDQVAIAFFVFGEDEEVVVSVSFGRRALDVVVGLLANVKLTAHNRLNSCVFGGVDKVDRAEDISVIRHGNGRHAKLFRPLAEFFHVARAIKHGIVGMEVQVDELGHEPVESIADF